MTRFRAIRLMFGTFSSEAASWRRRPTICIFFAAGIFVAALRGAAGASYSWQPASGDWSVAANWSGGTLPSGNDTAYIANGGTAAITLPGAVCNSLYVGDPSSANTGTVQMSGGGLSSSDEYVGSTGIGAFLQSGGTNNADSAFFGGGLYLGYNPGARGVYSLSGSGVLAACTEYVGYAGTGTFNQTGGTNGIGYGLGLVLGYNVGASGTYNLAAGSLSSPHEYEYVGYSGTGTFTQSGGTNSVGNAGYLYIGFNGSGSGGYSLSGSGALAASIEYVGYSGTGAFTQSGGTNSVGSNGLLYISYYGSGNYILSGSGALAAGAEYVGCNGTGAFTQSGGTNSVGTNLIVGYNFLSNGSYSLSGSGTLLAGGECLGYSGTGVFTQSGGTNTVGSNGRLYVGYACSGNYSLSGSGALLAGTEYVGYRGTGTFAQSGGTNNLGSSGSLFVGPQSYSYSSGNYSLSGSGVLSANAEYVGNSGTGIFVQTGGLNTVSSLSIGFRGRYQFCGGTLQIGSLANSGDFDATNSTGELTITGNSIFDLSRVTVINTGSMSVVVGPNALLLLPANFNPATALGSFVNEGETHIAGSPLIILSGQTYSGNFALADLLICQGAISPLAGGSITLNGGVTVSGTGGVNLGSGSIVVNNVLSGITGGSLSGFAGSVGSAAGSSGLFTQSGGTSSLSRLYLGANSISSSGRYSLSGSATLVASGEYVGSPGTGTFTQTGGLNSATALCIGGQGCYQFSGGTLQVGALSNYGVFDATGSTGDLDVAGGYIVDLARAILVNTGSMSLSVAPGSILLAPAGFNPSAFGSYSNLGALYYDGTSLRISAGQTFSGAFNLNDQLVCQGTLAAVSGGSTNLNCGVSISGTGNVNLGGGSFIADNALSNLVSGSLAATSGYVGYAGTGSFSQSGGTSNLNNAYFSGGLYLGYGSGASGTYNLNGAAVLSTCSEYVGNSGSGTLNQSGGNNSTSSFGALYVGYNAGSCGVYNQSGGTNNPSWPSPLYLGYNAGSSGTYGISGPGLLSASTEYVGYSGSGTFTQTGGTNTAGTLYVGKNGGSNGSYTLSAPGVVTASSGEYIGSSGSATFTQTGGSNSAGFVSIGSVGRYEFSAGTLQVSSFSNQGVFDGTGGAGLLIARGNSIIDFSQGILANVGAMSVSIGSNSLLLVPAGFNPATAFASYSNLGLTHTVGSPLSISPGQGFAGTGTIGDFVNCQGTISTNGAINLSNGLMVSGTGNVNLGSGTLTVNDVFSGVSGGSLAAYAQYVGNTAAGAFIQSAGTNTVSFGGLCLGRSEGISGSYSLSGSATLSTQYLYVGYSGLGTVAQNGETSVSGGYGPLYLGYNAGSSGGYNMGGSGVLSVTTEYVGYSGSGAFTQSGGANSVGALCLGHSSGGNGAYSLASGLLTAGTVSGGSGTGVFNFNGGTLESSGNNANFFSGLTAAYVQAGGAIIDVQGFNDTIAQSLSHDPSLGTTPDGGLTEIGSGVLTLTGTNTYTGPTTIISGTLVIANWLAIEDGDSLIVGDASAFDEAIAVPNGAGHANDLALNVVPEPPTPAILLAGSLLATLAGARRRRTRAV